MGKRTPFYDLHVKANAKIVDFAGWDMPLHYGSQIEEHHQVRQHAGMFDVSHMGVVDICGTEAAPFLRHLLANDITKLADGKALYTCMLNENGGVIDDLIVYQIAPDFFRLVVNAGTRDKDIEWMHQHANHDGLSFNERTDLAMLAVQGPKVEALIDHLFLPAEARLVKELKPFTFVVIKQWFIARTGYTGEDGYEIILQNNEAASLWQQLLDLGVKPCGLGARDTLRLEAGLNLYGNEMDESITPFEANLAWTVALAPQERDFIGRQSLEKQSQDGVKRNLVGVVLEGPGVIRHHQKIVLTDPAANEMTGEVTSGGYSPTLGKSIAFARLPTGVLSGAKCYVEIRHKPIPATITKPLFVRRGKKMI